MLELLGKYFTFQESKKILDIGIREKKIEIYKIFLNFENI